MSDELDYLSNLEVPDYFSGADTAALDYLLNLQTPNYSSDFTEADLKAWAESKPDLVSSLLKSIGGGVTSLLGSGDNVSKLLKLFALGGGSYALNKLLGDSNSGGGANQVVGYQGGIPKYTASREQLPLPYSSSDDARLKQAITDSMAQGFSLDQIKEGAASKFGITPNYVDEVMKKDLPAYRRPGAGGITYFSPMKYTKVGEAATTETAPGGTNPGGTTPGGTTTGTTTGGAGSTGTAGSTGGGSTTDKKISGAGPTKVVDTFSNTAGTSNAAPTNTASTQTANTSANTATTSGIVTLPTTNAQKYTDQQVIDAIKVSLQQGYDPQSILNKGAQIGVTQDQLQRATQALIDSGYSNLKVPTVVAQTATTTPGVPKKQVSDADIRKAYDATYNQFLGGYGFEDISESLQNSLGVTAEQVQNAMDTRPFYETEYQKIRNLANNYAKQGMPPSTIFSVIRAEGFSDQDINTALKNEAPTGGYYGLSKADVNDLTPIIRSLLHGTYGTEDTKGWQGVQNIAQAYGLSMDDIKRLTPGDRDIWQNFSGISSVAPSTSATKFDAPDYVTEVSSNLYNGDYQQDRPWLQSGASHINRVLADYGSAAATGQGASFLSRAADESVLRNLPFGGYNPNATLTNEDIIKAFGSAAPTDYFTSVGKGLPLYNPDFPTGAVGPAPTAPTTPPPGKAGGGIVSLQDGGFVVPARVVSELGNGSTDAGIASLKRRFPGSHGIRGRGDGVSDDIPARMSNGGAARVANGEVYIPRKDVSRLGGGDEKRGAEKLYKMLDRVERAAKSAKRGKDSKAYKHIPA